MLTEDIACFECGGNATLGEHRMDCGSKSLMDDYCNFIDSVPNLPDYLLDKVKTLVYAEQMERQIHKKRYGGRR